MSSLVLRPEEIPERVRDMAREVARLLVHDGRRGRGFGHRGPRLLHRASDGERHLVVVVDVELAARLDVAAVGGRLAGRGIPARARLEIRVGRANAVAGVLRVELAGQLVEGRAAVVLLAERVDGLREIE